MPKAIALLRLTSVLSLAITFLVALFILTSSMNFDFKFMYGGANFFLHLVCPILLFIIYFKYDSMYKLTRKELVYANLLTYIYGIIMIPLNIFKVVEGPYPFLMVYKQSVIMSIIWLVLIVGGTTLLGAGLYNIKKK